MRSVQKHNGGRISGSALLTSILFVPLAREPKTLTLALVPVLTLAPPQKK